MMAALMAPIEVPMIQSGSTPASEHDLTVVVADLVDRLQRS
jgi:hypothetical protein